MRLHLLVMLLLLGGARVAAAQHEHAHSPYAGLEGRQIKALSDSQIQQLQNGDGMSLALAAELNHYPGPRHVLELAHALGLSEEQQRQVREIEQAVRSKARGLGAAIIGRERRLDQGFANGTITDATLRRLTGEIARLEAELRYTHLVAHLKPRPLLTERQIKTYDELRGYLPGPPSP